MYVPMWVAVVLVVRLLDSGLSVVVALHLLLVMFVVYVVVCAALALEKATSMVRGPLLVSTGVPDSWSFELALALMVVAVVGWWLACGWCLELLGGVVDG